MSILNVASTRIRNVLKLPGLRLKADSSKCVSCGSCSRVCSMSLDVKMMVQNSEMDHPECIMCGECVSACGKGVIRRSFAGPDARSL
ncbi:4Fe-4S dicluster domain-containing protein [Paenibacillus sp. BR2-3]|uniref:4Fe-4S binding protein n=1 Tax=Paenibacillus sp. BR2-3 TaxID=3048494 RepID=UPI003977C23E